MNAQPHTDPEQEMQQAGQTLALQASQLSVITTDDQYRSVGALIKEAKGLIKQIDDLFNPLYRAAKDSVDKIRSRQNEFKENPQKAVSHYSRLISQYNESKAAEQRKLDEERAEAIRASQEREEATLKAQGASVVEVAEAIQDVAEKAEMVPAPLAVPKLDGVQMVRRPDKTKLDAAVASIKPHINAALQYEWAELKIAGVHVRCEITWSVDTVNGLDEQWITKTPR
jgi:hypothetical protein